MALPASTYDTATLVNPTSSLTDFTLIVDLSRMSAAWWAAVDTSDGTKGRAAKDSGPTELACDWIDFDNVAETGLLRVKWSGTLSDTGTQTLRIYPPQAANASVAANATYGSDNAYDSDWNAYWPLHNENDRTANGYDLTAQGGITVGGVGGKIGAATDFVSASSEWLEYNGTALVEAQSTIVCWFNLDVDQGQALWYAQPVSGTGYRRAIDGTYIRYREWDGSTVAEFLTTAVNPANGTWYYSAATYTSNSLRKGWVNTSSVTNTTTTTGTDPLDSFNIGRAQFGGLYLDGQMQHVQIHSGVRSDEWIEYEYDQTNDQATFWGTWTNVPVAAGISIPVVMHHRRIMGVS